MRNFQIGSSPIHLKTVVIALLLESPSENHNTQLVVRHTPIPMIMSDHFMFNWRIKLLYWVHLNVSDIKDFVIDKYFMPWCHRFRNTFSYYIIYECGLNTDYRGFLLAIREIPRHCIRFDLAYIIFVLLHVASAPGISGVLPSNRLTAVMSTS